MVNALPLEHAAFASREEQSSCLPLLQADHFRNAAENVEIGQKQTVRIPEDGFDFSADWAGLRAKAANISAESVTGAGVANLSRR
jgi:hypothetical protein